MVIATKNRITAVVGSTRTPTLNVVLPVGSQATDDSMGCSPKCSTPTAYRKTAMLPRNERKAAPTAIVWLNALLRFVNSTINANARTGGSGISQVRVLMVSSVIVLFLPLHHVDVIRHDRVASTID